jgi:hypothetical protein
MLFISVEDFLAKAKNAPRLTQEEEKRLAQERGQNTAARDRLVCGYLPLVAARIRRAPKELQNLQTVYACLAALEKGVDSFNFLQDSEPFSHHLSWSLRQCIVRRLAERR